MALKSMPLMPNFDVNFNPDEDEEEDAAEEKNLMTILLKLKNAKSSLAATRKRKHFQQSMDDAHALAGKENKDDLNKFKKRWMTKISQLSTKAESIKEKSREMLETCQELSKSCTAVTVEQRATIERLLSSFVVLEKEVETLRDANHKEAALKEIAVAKLQVTSKMEQLEGALKKINSEAGKEDRFTKLIKTIMCNF